MKFCSNCGTQLSDDAKFCGSCGAVQEAPQPQYTQPQYTQPQYTQPQYTQPQYTQPQYEMQGTQTAGEQPKKKFPIWIIPVAVAVVAAIVVLIVFLVKKNSGGSSTVKGAVEAYMDAMSDFDADAYIDATLSKDMLKAIAIAEDMDVDEYVEYIENLMDKNKDYYGKLKIKINEVGEPEYYDREDIEDFIEEAKDETGITLKIQAMCDVEVEYSEWTESSGEWEDYENEFSLYKMGGRWYVME